MIKLRYAERSNEVIPITLPSPEAWRSDPAVIEGCAALAAAVIRNALETLSDTRHSQSERDAALQFLLSNPHGDGDLDRVLAHWWGYFSRYRSVHHLHRLARWAAAHPRTTKQTTWHSHYTTHEGGHDG